jgi:hypothetical protein
MVPRGAEGPCGEAATETDPATVRELMAAIAEQAERDREFAGLLHESGVLVAKAFGANIVPAEGADDQ